VTKEEWYSLKVGDYVCMHSPIPRKILNVQNRCITLLALKKTKYGKPNTVYAKNDRYKFTKVIL